MKKLTYKEAYDKIIDAYFKDEINPYDREFCFCGTLARSSAWLFSNDYNIGEFKRMEYALLSTIMNIIYPNDTDIYCQTRHDKTKRDRLFSNPQYEDALFQGMCAGLDVLKQIHKELGENVVELPALTKRKLLHHETN